MKNVFEIHIIDWYSHVKFLFGPSLRIHTGRPVNQTKEVVLGIFFSYKLNLEILYIE